MNSVTETVDTLVQSFQEHKNTSEIRLEKLEVTHARPESSLAINHNGVDSEHKQAFNSYLRKGEEAPLKAFEQKGLSTLTESDGGYLIPQSLVDRIETNLESASVIRAHANVMSISTSSVDLLLSKRGAAVGWTAENGDRDETQTPQVNKLVIPVHEMYAKTRATQKLLDDSAVNVEQWISKAVSTRMAEIENQAFLFGDGNNKPKGLLTFETADDAVWGSFSHIKLTPATRAQLADKLIDMSANVKNEYLSDAVWVMSRTTLAALRKLKDSEGRYIWQPGMETGGASMLLGHQVVLCDEMPSLTANTGSMPIVFGSLKKAYQVVDRQGTYVLRDPYSSKPYVEFYTTKRVGGNVVDFDAITVLKLANNPSSSSSSSSVS